MTYSPPLASTITNTRMRTPEHLSTFSGMCAVCTANCIGPCEIGLSAVRGSEAIYPYKTDINQFASEKEYSLDFSHLNINGRVFGAVGCPADAEAATFPHADITAACGLEDPIPLLMPVVLPAIAKLNWPDYYAGAALAGVMAVIGEDVVAKDPGLELEHGKVVAAPLIASMVDAFRQHERGYGDIILQANYDDEYLGVLDYAISKLGVKSVELKFGQAAKGIQGMERITDFDKALMFKKRGYIVHPDPSDPEVVASYRLGHVPIFERIGKLPMWDESTLVKRVAELRELGAQLVCFKTGAFDPSDLVKILKIASAAGVDLVTFDGAGGGSGNSPSKMMNEWGIPTVEMVSILYRILQKMDSKGYRLPQVAIAGGFAMEDQVYKGLALGAPYTSLVAIGRAAMAAATIGKQVGELIAKGTVPKDLQRFGSSLDEIFSDLKELRGIYGEKAEDIAPGAIGVYSYLNRVGIGVKQLMALNRKFNLKAISRADIAPLTELAAQVTGLPSYSALAEAALLEI